MKEKMCLIGLSKVKGLGPRRLEILLSYFGSAEGVWRAKSNLLYCLKEIPSPVIDNLMQVRSQFNADKEAEYLAKSGILIYDRQDKEYPERLKMIHSAPALLYVRGTLPDFEKPCVAIVGARRCTPYGLKMAADLSEGLGSAGVTVISGMARGIDSAAHKGCLSGGGATVAVLGTGVDVVYPKENKRLMDKIIEQGAVVSEYPPGTKPDPGHFPCRNRIISGLSQAVLVVEAARTSGSLITADLALEQGRDVYAVPGQAVSPLSAGTNHLIKQGAKLVDCVEDILEEMGLQPLGTKPEGADLNSREKRLLSHLSLIPVTLEDLVQVSGMVAHEVSSVLLLLELKGLIRRYNGNMFVSNT